MAVTVRIPTQLRSATGGASEAHVEGGTVSEVLDALYAQFGELRGRIADEHGSLRRFVNVYLAGEDIRFLDGVETSVPDGSELTILPAVAGGQALATTARRSRYARRVPVL
jgi:molybdopterin converting factor small subunit